MKPLLKNLRLAFAAMLVLCATQAYADSSDVADANGNVLRYSYDSGEGTAATFSLIVSLNEDAEKAKHIIVSSTVEGNDGFVHTVKAVAQNACSDKTSIVSIVLPDGITTLGSSAFSGCTNLESINLPEGITNIPASCFSGCTKLEVVQIPAGVTTIGSSAFYNSGIKKFKAPAALTSIGGSAFNECSALEEIDMGEAVNLATINSYAFSGTGNVKRIVIGSDYSGSSTYLTTSANIESVVFTGNCTKVTNSLLNGKSKLTDVTIGESVTAIGNYAFQSCTALTDITLPSGITSLGQGAFQDCTALESINLPDGITNIPASCFSGCTKLEAVQIPAGVTTIGSSAFYNSGIKKFKAPAALTSIGGSAFNECSALEEIDLGEAVNLATISGYAFSGTGNVKRIVIGSDYSGSSTYLTTSANIESVVFTGNCTKVTNSLLSGKSKLTDVTIGESVTAIGNYAFQSCTALTDISLPSGITSLGQSAFDGCTSLESINLPDGITSLPANCFYNCSKLNISQIPAGVTTIGSSAFYNSGIKKFKAPAALTSIGGSAFSECKALEEVDLGEAVNLATINSYAFSGTGNVKRVVIGSDITYSSSANPVSMNAVESVVFTGSCTQVPANFCSGRSNLVSVSLCEGITSIGREAFYNCKSLPEIELPSTLTTIGDYAFRDCDALTSVTIPEGIVTLPTYCFYGSDELKSVTLPNSLESINNYAFYQCGKLETVNLGTGLKTINQGAFEYCYALKSINLEDTQLETLNGSDIFFYCNALQELTLPATVQTISSSYTLRSINNLKKVTILTAAVPFTAATNFPEATVLYVPAALVDAYKENQYTKDFRIIALGSTLDFDIATTAGGQLQEKIEAIGEAVNVISLRVSGPINGTDIEYLHRRLTSIADLDLGDAQIVNGGDSYHVYTISNSGVATQSGSSSFNTETDIIGDYMFANLPLLEKLVLPQTATRIGYQGVGGNLLRLADLTLPATLEEIGSCAFSRYQSYNYYRGTALTALTLPASLRKIGSYAFYGTLITDITIPEGVTRIEERTFYDSELKHVSLPESLTYIGRNAFYSTPLEELVLPAMLDTIEQEAFYNCSEMKGELRIPGGVKTLFTYAFSGCSKLTSLTLENGVETVGNYAFRNCDRLQDVSLPNTLKNINQSAFYSCDSLKQITIPESVETIGSDAFSYCKSLRSFSFPDNVKEISTDVLSYCDSLRSVTLAEGTTKINNNAFRNCPKLTECNFNQRTLTYIGNYAFANTGFVHVTLPDEAVLYGQCFQNCENLESINIPTATTYVPSNFVQNCAKLTSVQMHDGIRTLNNYCFSGCSALPSVELNDEITGIGERAFFQCSVLELDALPSALTSIGAYAFGYCSAIKSLTIPQDVTIYNDAFSYSGLEEIDLSAAKSIGTSVFEHCTSLRTVVWNNSWTTIPSYTFSYCTALESFPFYDGIETIKNSAFNYSGLKSASLHTGLKTIENSAFYQCRSLASVDFPETLTTIGQSAFGNCSALESVTIPDGVTTINNYAFQYCAALKEARLGRNMDYMSNSYFDYFFQNENMELLRVFSGTVPPINSYYAPKNRANCVLEVPMGTEELYAAADVWKEFKEIRGFLTGDKLAAEDFAILCQFYEEMGGENWTNKWDLTTDDRYIGKWYGVTTEGDHVTKIEVKSNNLTGDLKETIFNLPEMQILNLYNNNITGRLENVLGENFTNEKITYVSLKANKMEGDIAPFANKLPNLTSLFLQHNQLTAISQPLSDKLTNSTSYLDYSYQFIDPVTYEAFETENNPAIRIYLGEPLAWTPNTLQTYRHSNKDYSADTNYLYLMGRSYSDYYKSWSAIWNGYYHFKKDSSGDYVAGTTYNISGITKGTLTTYGLTTGGARTQNFVIDWTDGDVNIDRTVDILDLQSVLYYALNDSRPSSSPYNYITADANGDNAMDIRDAVLAVNRILDYDEESGSLARALYNIMSEDEDAATVRIEDSTLKIDNAEGIAAMQFLLSGCNEDDISLSRDMRGFSVKAKQTAQGLKVIVYNLNGELLGDGEQSVFTGLPEGTSVADVRLSDENAERMAVRIVSGPIDGIDKLNAPDTNTNGFIYNMEGRIVAKGNVSEELRKLPAGIYVLNIEGKSLKVTKK